MATISSGSMIPGGYTPSGSGGFMNSGLSYEQVRYNEDLREATRPGSMSFGSLPRLPGEAWNDFMSRQSSFNKTFSSDMMGSASSAMRNYLGLGNIYKPTRPSTSRISGGGGGGGGGAMMMMPPTPVEFYLGKPPELQKLDLDYTQMGKRVQEANLPTIEEYKRATPGEEATLRALSQSAADYAAGKIPQSVLEQTQRSIAQSGYGTGLGVGGGRRAGGLQRAFGARDILTTSLGLQQQAQQMAAAIPQIMQQRYAAQYQVSPTQVFDTAVSQASINQQLANQQLLMNWMAQPLPGQYDITKGSYVGFGAPGTRVTTRPEAPGIGRNYSGSAYNPFG